MAKKQPTQVEVVNRDGSTRTAGIFEQHLAATLGTPKGEDGARTVDLTWYTGAAIRRGGGFGPPYTLSFSMDPAHVRMERLQSGRAPILDAHKDYSVRDVIGVIERAWLEGKEGKATARFSRRPELDAVWADIQAGILRNASMGVFIHKLKDVSEEDAAEKAYLATDWEPHEVSLVPVGADPGASFTASLFCELSDLSELHPAVAGGGTMSQQTTGASAGVSADERAKLITDIGRRHNLAAFAAEHIGKGTTLEAFRKLALEELAKRDEALPDTRAQVSFISDARETGRARMAEALACRYSGKAPSDPAREFMGAPVSELARECLQAAGIRIPRQPSEIIRLAAMQTADFPGLLTGTGQRLLLDAYAAATPAIKLVARRSTVTDFRTKYILRLGEAPSLLKITEANPEIQHGLRAEVKESYRAYTYARIFPITREALINDDLSAFADFVRAFGIAAATLEGTLLSDLLVSNPTMSDTYALFATEHSNLNSGAGSAFGTSGLSAARKGMRLQTGIDGTTVLDIPPAFVVGPAALETSIESVLTAITYPATPTDANVFLNRLKPVIVPYLFTAS